MENIEFVHRSVLYNECLDSLCIKPGGIYVDGTAGGAGHSSGIAARLEDGKLYAFDRDIDAVMTATERLSRFGDRAEVIHSNYSDIKKQLSDTVLTVCTNWPNSGILIYLYMKRLLLPKKMRWKPERFWKQRQ